MGHKTFTPPVAVDRAYELWLWLEGRVQDFPTAQKHQLGRRILDGAIDAMDALLQATYSPRGSAERPRALHHANHRLALVRLLLRGARERRLLSIDQHEHAAKQVAELGTMVGAWLRNTQRVPTSSPAARAPAPAARPPSTPPATGPAQAEPAP